MPNCFWKKQMPHIYREIIPYNFIISTFRTLSSTISESTTFCLEDAYTDLNLKKKSHALESGKFNAHSNTRKRSATTQTVPLVVARAIPNWSSPVYLVALSPPCLRGALPSSDPRYCSDVAVWVAPAVSVVFGQWLTVNPTQICSINHQTFKLVEKKITWSS